jgi:exopolysaccharide biosynthesis polyprenyl glycosylphosphotransferase
MVTSKRISGGAVDTVDNVRAPGVDVSGETRGAGEPGTGSTSSPPVPSTRRAFRRLTLGLVLADALCIIGTLLLVDLLHPNTRGSSGHFLLVLVVAPVAWVAILHAFHLYGGDHLPPWEEFRGIISATAVGVVVIIVGSFWWDETLSRTWLGWAWVFALLFELVVRRVFRWYVRHAKRTGRLTLRTLIVGTGTEAGRIRQALSAPVRGFEPVGYLAVSDLSSADGLPVLGDLLKLETTILDHGIECVFVASSEVSASDIAVISRACRRADAQIRVSTNLPEILMSRFAVQVVDDVTALSVRPVRLTGARALVKRSVDLLLGAIGLLVVLPFLVLIGLAIRLTSRGPALFRQQRVTKDGRLFTMVKFRTMVTDPERALQGKLIDLSKPFFKLTDDPRLTRVGRVLRALSLDELPQLWNVVKGDMSLVGPRPLPVDQVEAHPELLAPRHEVRAGMTGWWQVHGRSDVDYERALKLDIFYIENWSLTLDLYIILKTIGVILARRGAR